MITRSQFRLLVLLYIVILIAATIYGVSLASSVQKLIHQHPMPIGDSTSFFKKYAGLVALHLLLGFVACVDFVFVIVSLIGLYYFKNWARFTFAVSKALAYTIIFLSSRWYHALLKVNPSIVNFPVPKMSTSPIGYAASGSSLIILICAFSRIGSHLFLKGPLSIPN
jgi:hypothetical protein